jgi:hypothetical protein
LSTLIILLPGHHEVSLNPEVAARLGDLGVTNVSVLRDDETVGFVLEGWAFDPDRSADAAQAILDGDGCAARKLQPLMHMAVSHPARVLDRAEQRATAPDDIEAMTERT